MLHAPNRLKYRDVTERLDIVQKIDSKSLPEEQVASMLDIVR